MAAAAGVARVAGAAVRRPKKSDALSTGGALFTVAALGFSAVHVFVRSGYAGYCEVVLQDTVHVKHEVLGRPSEGLLGDHLQFRRTAAGSETFQSRSSWRPMAVCHALENGNFRWYSHFR